jgi:Domain of unknown function (DUF1887)
MTTLISLVSDQTIPNVLFIKQFHADRYVFLETDHTRDKKLTEAIIKAVQRPEISNLSDNVLVDAENFNQCLLDLEQLQIPEGVVVLHITGGTKIMALAVVSYFADHFDGRYSIYYKGLKDDFAKKIFPTDGVSIPLSLNLLTIQEYIFAYGLEFKMPSDRNIAKENESKQMLSHFRKRENLEQFKSKGHVIYDHVKNKFNGEWLEIALALEIQEFLKLDYRHIIYGAKMGNPGEDGIEIDIAFLYKKNLYIIECKYFPDKSNNIKSKIKPDWYKLAGLRLRFGLSAKSFFVIANTIPPVNQKDFDETKKVNNIEEVFDISMVLDKQKFTNFLHSL